ncbi:MAG: SOS response-associated peptidase [Phycisphaerae bacterium]|nr:SOS response-associated peptidase [Phycisphaerae bacterium]
MCGRISLKTPARILAEIFGVDIPTDLPPRYNIAPTQRTLIVRAAGHGREASMARWGYIPSWRNEGEKGPEPINARSETAAASRLFAQALRTRRCIVPAGGFYEWKADGRVKRPYHVEPVDADVFALAGLWSPGQHAGADPPDTFTILTCAPNEVMRPIHDRMPVILPMTEIGRWLDPATDDAATVAAMLRPAPAAGMIARPVTMRVNSPKHDDPGCLESDTGGTLFAE